MNSNPYQTIFYLENDKLAYMGFVFVWRPGKNFKLSPHIKVFIHTTYLLGVHLLKKSSRPTFIPLVKLRKEILWKISASKFCLMGVSPFSIKIQLEIEKLAYVGFGFV